MIAREALERLAHQDCLEHAKGVVSGELIVDLLEEDLEWDPIALRHVFDQPMVIWRRFGEFQVILDEANRPVGFLDPGNRRDCAWAPLDIQGALEVVRESGWLSGQAEADGQVGRSTHDSAVLAVRDPGGAVRSQRWLVEINPVTKQLISILPQREKSGG